MLTLCLSDGPVFSPSASSATLVDPVLSFAVDDRTREGSGERKGVDVAAARLPLYRRDACKHSPVGTLRELL